MAPLNMQLCFDCLGLALKLIVVVLPSAVLSTSLQLCVQGSCWLYQWQIILTKHMLLTRMWAGASWAEWWRPADLRCGGRRLLPTSSTGSKTAKQYTCHTATYTPCSPNAYFTPQTWTRQDCLVLSCPRLRCEINSHQVKTVSDRKFRNWTCSDFFSFVQSRNAVWIEFCLVLTQFPICN